MANRQLSILFRGNGARESKISDTGASTGSQTSLPELACACFQQASIPRPIRMLRIGLQPLLKLQLHIARHCCALQGRSRFLALSLVGDAEAVAVCLIHFRSGSILRTNQITAR